MIIFAPEDRRRAADFRAAAERALATATDPAALGEAYRTIRAWHDAFHSPNRPPYLNCTGCTVWPVIAALAVRLGFDPLRPPREFWV